jgi:hypothetical protein
VIGLRAFPPGVGRSKKEAEQAAAKRALEILSLEESAAQASTSPSATQANGGSAAP